MCHHRSSLFYEVLSKDGGVLTIYEYSLLAKESVKALDSKAVQTGKVLSLKNQVSNNRWRSSKRRCLPSPFAAWTICCSAPRVPARCQDFLHTVYAVGPESSCRQTRSSGPAQAF